MNENLPESGVGLLSRHSESTVNYKEKIQGLEDVKVEVPASVGESRPSNLESLPSNLDQSSRPPQRKKHERSFSAQFRAIMKKNFALQAKQRGTNCCQILTPIVCLLFILLIQKLAAGKLDTYTFALNVPYLYNVPYENFYTQIYKLYNSTGTPPIQFSTCLQWYLYDIENSSDQETIDFVGNETSGLLSRIFPPVDELKESYNCQDLGLMPFFKTPNNGSTINNQLYNDLVFLNSLSYKPPRDVPMLSLIPDGAVTFYEASPDSLTIGLQVNDLRMYEFHRANGVTRYQFYDGSSTTQVTNVFDGQLILLDLITNAYNLHANNGAENGFYIISGSQVMPETTSGAAILQQIISLVGASLYPIALSLLLPVYMYTIVLEKEERLREIMKMNGLKMTNYWVVNYIWCFALYLVSVILFILFGRFVLGTIFFTDTNFLVLIVVMIGWGLSQVSLSFFYQNFLYKAKTAIIIGYLLAMWTTILGVTYSIGVYPSPDELPLVMRLYPAFAFVRLIYYLTYYCGATRCVQDFSEFNSEMISCIEVLFIGAVVFLIIGIYLDQVMPQEYGVRKHPLFFLKWCKRRKVSDTGELVDAMADQGNVISQNKNLQDELNKEFEDEDVKKEREYVNQLHPPFNNFPLIIKNLRKIYKAIGGKPPKVAVKNFSLHMKRGDVFGLLGPNGAGKTSLIAMLTGLYPPESGNAWVGGFNILNQIDSVHMEMGVCPQFDLLWPDLTVEEHLLFYARIRGVPTSEEKELVKKAIKEVYLTRFTNFRTQQLSGGMKRRLSVALALVGNPQIIFLDEPTTGLDPENRRQLWNILVEARGERAMVLTTHSMEEADVLCTRIGIITDGALRCIGPQTSLKAKYGGGYHLFINCHKDRYFEKHTDNRHSIPVSIEEHHLKLQEFVKRLLPKAELKSSFNGNFIYLVPLEGLEVSRIFEEFESRKQELGIADWGISQSSLEDVFMQIVDTSDSLEDEVPK